LTESSLQSIDLLLSLLDTPLVGHTGIDTGGLEFLDLLDSGVSYEERVQKREEEIDALKTALCQLDPEGVEAECGP
jgi:hypothetical protein